jgi:integrase
MIDGIRYDHTFAREEDALVYAAEIKTGRAETKSESMSVGTAFDRYIAMKDAVLSPSTISAYRRIRKNHLQSIMGMRLDRLTPEAVQRAVNQMARDGLNPKTIRNAYGLLTAVLGAFRPSLTLNTTLPQKIRYEAAVPSDGDIVAILRTIPDTEAELPITMAMWLGMRMSEILGLKWEDADLDNRVIHIRRALVDEGEKTTKTYTSQRDLTLPEHIVLLLGDPGEPDEHVVKMTRRRILTLFHRVCEDAGVQQFRFHDLRHINASVMLMLGIPDKYSMKRMGHATNNMLKTVYQHTMDKKMTESVNLLDQYFESKLPIFHTKFHTPEEISLMCSGL